MWCQTLLQHLANIGTPLCTSEQLARRVVWTNICAMTTSASVILAVIVSTQFSATSITEPATTLRCVLSAIAACVLALNKFGWFTISRFVLIISCICIPTIVAVSRYEKAFDVSFMLTIPIALSSTLFDPTAYIHWVPLQVLCAVCYTGIQWVNVDNTLKYVLVVKVCFGLLVMLVISVCFHLLAIASRHDREQELAQMVADLQSEIDARKVVEESLRKATRAKQEFLATMSHEIRTPMNGVIASADLLSDTPLNAEQQDLTDTIKSSALALITIINDILDFSKIEAGKMTIESVPFNVRELVEQVLDCLAPKADERGVELVCDVAGPLLSDSVVLCDAGRFRQVLLNILGNAVKFTHVGTVVVYAQLLSPLPDPSQPASSSGQEDDGDSSNNGENRHLLLQLEVEDTGEGIPHDRLESMFEEFTQADTSISRRHGGTGLGLAISKKLVELMGGSIGVKSQLGQGSTFAFSVLVERSGGTEAGAEAGTVASFPSPWADSPLVLPAHSTPPLVVVVVVWEPLARARDALCRLLHYHHQQQQQQQQQQQGEQDGQMVELVVRTVSDEPDLTAVLQVLGESQQQQEGRRRSVVLVCDYRLLLLRRSCVARAGTDDTAEQKKQAQQRWDLLCGLLQRLDAGVVLLGPCSHRSGVEAGIESKCESNLSQPPPRPMTMEGRPNNLTEAGGRRLADVFLPTRWCETGCSGGDSNATTPRRRRWGYVNKPVHQAALLRTLCLFFKQRAPSGPPGGGVIAGAVRQQGVVDDVKAVVGGEVPPPPGGGGRVLVVEDNKVNQKVMGKMLRRLGVEFDIVENGQLAVEALRSHIVAGGGGGGGGGLKAEDENEEEEKKRQFYSYGVVLMDCHMPVMDGYEATAAIRQLESECTEASGTEETKGATAAPAPAAALEGVGVSNCSSRVPIIAVTASALEEELQRCRDVGMNRVLSKPVRLKQLSEVLEEYLGGVGCQM